MANGDQPQVPDHLADLRIQPAETTLQTVKRNVTPTPDTSRASLGPGHEFDQDSPQAAGEQQYRESMGSPLERAYGHAKQFLATHEQQLSEKYLAPFRKGLDNMADDLEGAASSGTTKSGGTLTPVTRALVGGAGAALRMVPIGSNVKETAAMAITPPELGPEGKALSRELKTGERAAVDFSELRIKPLTPNASGESGASMEAINRAKQEKLEGVRRVRVNTLSNKEIPLIGPDAVDAKAGPHDRIVLRKSDGSETVLDEGAQARPAAQKAPSATTPTAKPKPESKPNVYDLGEIDTKSERRATPGASPTGAERRTLPLKDVTGPPPEQVRLISEAKKQVAAAKTVAEMTTALNRIKHLTGTEAGFDIAQSGGEKLGQDIRKARAAKPAEPIQRATAKLATP